MVKFLFGPSRFFTPDKAKKADDTVVPARLLNVVWTKDAVKKCELHVSKYYK